MSKSTSRRDEAALNWKPRLKNAPKGRRSTSTSATTNVADQALSAMRRIDQVRDFNGDVEACAAKLAGAPTQRDVAVAKLRAAAGAGRRNRRAPLLAGLAVAGVCVVAVAAMWRSPARHTMAGNVYLEKRPLAAAELRFHPAGAEAEALTVVAAEDGRFRLNDVAPGSYRVTIHPPASSTALPMAEVYTAPEKTPLQVHLTRDIDRLRLVATKVAPKPRQATWTPGVD